MSQGFISKLPTPLPLNKGGTGALLTLPVITQIKTQTFISSGTYTPTAGMKYCLVELVGGGGGGAGAPGAGTGSVAGGGGGAGGYARKLFSAATISTGQTVTVGGYGSGGAAGMFGGASGGTTSLGSLLSATGGSGAPATGAGFSSITFNAGAFGGVGSLGDFNSNGGPGQYGLATGTNNTAGFGGKGGDSFFAAGGAGAINASAYNAASTAYGGGGGGGGATSGNVSGGNGCGGLVIITEYISV